MFDWIEKKLERRRHIRRESDQQLRMRDAIQKKKDAALDALEKLNQWQPDRRFHVVAVEFERRRA